MSTQHAKEKLSLGVLLLIAVCLIFTFYAVSIAVSRNIRTMAQNKKIERHNLPNYNKNANSIIF